ncbi:hypothetical protein [Shewanella maritima]|uniref:hypothetical protein n=1 Tax=Shewanella maritima TaxID=2520507 RepID=UPI003734FC0C
MSVLTARVSAVAIACMFGSVSMAHANSTSSLSNPNISAVLDGYYQSGERAMSERVEGFGLGETELAISANIDDMFYGKLTTVLEMHDGDTEVHLEEAFIQTLALPGGMSIRAGRFLSDIGYLNNQHPHTDSFSERPAAYRAFLGGHYFDDGVRFSYVAPTDLYWTMGAEAFSGKKMRAEDEHGERDFKDVGIYTAFTKIGGDIGQHSSWQLGLNYMRNENGKTIGEEGHEHELVDEDEHDHSHSAHYIGENTYIADFVYKWAPQGNYKYQHLTLSGEYFRTTDIFAVEEHDDHEEMHEHDDYYQGWYLSGAYQFSPSWSAGIRYGEVDGYEIHGDHLDEQKLKETEVSLAWHSSHFSTVRLQYTNQRGTNFDGFEDDNIITLQYVMTLGAHGAHQF